jgi:glycosyltransferase involved in cell wall biosynthesis
MLLQVRNEMDHLPRLMENITGQVDGVIALDDGSTDGSRQYLEARPEVLELIANPPNRPRWDEVGNHRKLVHAGLAHDADWFICLDGDERVEMGFRSRVERLIQRGEASAYAVRLRELWDDPKRYRADGIWGKKAPPRLFKALPDHEFDERAVHSFKAPLQAKVNGSFKIADVNVYHLGMLRPEDRFARRARYEALDPECKFQPDIGYAYLTDETGLELRPVPSSRDYVG